jgi:hypothetical protein
MLFSISTIAGKLKKDYRSLMVALFFVAASLLVFLFTPETGVIKEGAGSVLASHGINAANAAKDYALNAPQGGLLPPQATQEQPSNSITSALQAPEFLSLGEIKDPGLSVAEPINQSGTVAYNNDKDGSFKDMAFLGSGFIQPQ